MKLTKEQKEQMNEIFPDGWEENDIPALWRDEAEDKIAEELEDERFDYHPRPEEVK